VPHRPRALRLPLGGVLVLGRAPDGEERVGPRHARRARPHASCARLRVAPIPILRIAFHAVRQLPGLVEQHPSRKDAGMGALCPPYARRPPSPLRTVERVASNDSRQGRASEQAHDGEPANVGCRRYRRTRSAQTRRTLQRRPRVPTATSPSLNDAGRLARPNRNAPTSGKTANVSPNAAHAMWF
jgi:hypothetical protein